MTEGERFSLRDIIITVVISTIMGLSNFFSLFIAVPLMNFAYKHGKKETALTALTVLGVLFGYSFYIMKGSAYYLFMVLMNMYIPLSLSAAGIIWTSAKNKRVDARLLLSVLPSFVLVLFFAVVFCADRALFTSVYNGYKDAFVPVISEMFTSLGLGIDVEFFFLILITAAAVVMFPLVVGAACVSYFLFGSVVHSREGDWDEKLYSIEFSSGLIWLLILSLALTLVSRLISVPAVLFILSMSVLTASLIIYGVQGFSVLYYWLKKKVSGLKSTTLFFTLALISILIPGLNLIVLLGVPVIGILENFFDLKKRKVQ